MDIKGGRKVGPGGWGVEEEKNAGQERGEETRN